ncbi:EamA family transporter [Thalassomonas sp. M1454]|uniref:EamA family transporter n=1 Tax=Thalassomonas sp. M1454 TaxID=2594477 RepID=UPI0011816291|nr:EamA family transporter [Thalassomonas sp. M1454]TRX58025.1 EamA family transporter [Thalassomonas sp. M1454]
MWQLVLVSVIWAFSFGLIKGQLTGIDPSVVASIRLLLCVIAFLPCLFFAKSLRPNLKLVALGSVQFGLMYLLYINSYQYLPGYLVAVFTIFTPLYVVLINSVISKNWQLKMLYPVVLSIVGAAIIVFKDIDQDGYLLGFVLLQLANIAFASGQVGYKYLAGNGNDRDNMLWMYLGGALLATLYCLTTADIKSVEIDGKQWLALFYLGVISSGLCFYLWNKGARVVNATTLAVMNNGYVPLAVIFSVTIFAESADLVRLMLGGSVILLSVLLAQKQNRDLTG